MEISCSTPSCKGKVSGKCFCNRNTNFFCMDHLTSHLQSKGTHSVEKILYSEVPQRNEIIMHAYALIQQLSRSRLKVLQEYQRLMQEVECQTDSILGRLRELELLCENVVKSAAGSNEKEFTKNLYIDYILSLDFPNLCNELSSWQGPIVEITNVSLAKLFGLNPLTPPFTHFPLSLEQSASISLYELHHSVSNELSYFKQNTKILVTINAETGEKFEKELNIPENMPYGAGIMELPGGNIFHAGGTLGNPIGSCYLMKNGKIEKLKSFRPRASPAIAYCDGKVYAIGGRDGKYVKDCEVFSLLTKEWKTLPPIPETSNGLIAVNFAAQILFAGYFHKKLFCFDTFTYAYSEIVDVNEGNKVLTVGNGQGYIFCNRKLMESSFGNIKEWKIIKDISYTGGWCVNHPIRVNNFIYFLVDYCQKELWRFDLNSKDVLLVSRY